MCGNYILVGDWGWIYYIWQEAVMFKRLAHMLSVFVYKKSYQMSVNLILLPTYFILLITLGTQTGWYKWFINMKIFIIQMWKTVFLTSFLINLKNYYLTWTYQSNETHYNDYSHLCSNVKTIQWRIFHHRKKMVPWCITKYHSKQHVLGCVYSKRLSTMWYAPTSNNKCTDYTVVCKIENPPLRK